jgi:hypothetical protein
MMFKKSLYRQTLVVGVFLVSGCDLAQNAQRDFNRAIHSTFGPSYAAQPAPAASARATSPTPKPAATAAKTDAKSDESKTDSQQAAAIAPVPATVAPANVNLVGKSESQLRAMLGPPTSVEERAPGKTWRYRDGRCRYDVQLYPDVQTRQFGTLAYEVKSDDNSDEGKRDCMARLQSRAQ